MLVKQDSVAVQDSVIAFFTQWLPDYDEDWLPNHATPLDQLNIVYESDRTGFLVAWLDEFGIAPANAVLKGIKGLTGTAYTEIVGTAVLTGTLNPSYNPPQVNTPDPDNLLGETMYLAEHHLYGSSRLGIKHYDSLEYRAIYDQEEEALTVATLNARRPWYSFSQSDWIKKDKASEFTGATYNLSLDTLRERRWIGRKEYELTDHLGNVLVTFLDRKTGYGNSSGSYIGFNADIASITDYYPFGMPMEERSVINGGGFRFGFNGMEKDNEIAGVGNHYTALFWEMDPRIARRWNLDPKPQINISDYAILGNNPIINTDPLGDVFNKWDTKSSKKEYKFNSYYGTNTKYFADEANLNSFAKAAIELATDNIIFAQVYTQLSKSKNLYTIQQEYTNTANYKSETKTINMKYRGVGKDAYIPKTEVFEEVFHAGQDEYYSARGIKRSHLEDEVEAKVADIISGHQDDAVNGEYKSIKNYFKTGKKDKNFDSELNTLIKDVDKLYNDNDNTEGKQWRKNNDPKQVDKKNVLNYLETLTPATKSN